MLRILQFTRNADALKRFEKRCAAFAENVAIVRRNAWLREAHRFSLTLR
jgi:hypothetical protein